MGRPYEAWGEAQLQKARHELQQEAEELSRQIAAMKAELFIRAIHSTTPTEGGG